MRDQNVKEKRKKKEKKEKEKSKPEPESSPFKPGCDGRDNRSRVSTCVPRESARCNLPGPCGEHLSEPRSLGGGQSVEF